jgi:glyoxylase-like metal-dependent hydrolase (beta-lactamase superfamily II)/rhodanese-related sulfurtransferase
MEKEFVFEQLNPDACRTYFVGSLETREAVLIDPVLGATEAYLKYFASGPWTLRYVIDTHTHADHLSGGTLLSDRTGATYAMHKKAGAKHATLHLTDGSTVAVGGIVLEAIDTPGHTRDSVSLKLPGRLLTGDFLFIGGAGRTDLPGGDPGDHWDSLTRVIPSLDESTLLYPGHDYNGMRESTLRDERRVNANLKPRGRDEYIAWLSAMERPTPPWMIDTVRANNEGPTDPSLNFMPKDEVSACMCEPSPSIRLPELSVEEVRSLVASGGASRRLLLDVRQPDEYEGELGHVPGAILIPLPELPSRLSEIESYRDKRVIAICRSGSRSAKATALLMESGFEDVWNMTGGTLAWREKGFPVER